MKILSAQRLIASHRQRFGKPKSGVRKYVDRTLRFVSIRSSFLTWALFVVLFTAVSSGDEVGTSTNGLQGLHRFRMSVVEVETLEKPGRHVENGVIITSEGHVVIHERYRTEDRRVRVGDRLQFHLTDGRTVQGKALGWSDEWGITLAKVTENGLWPHVELCPTAEVRAGIACIALGSLSVVGPGSEQVDHTLMSFGTVHRVASNQWLTSTCPMNNHNGVFDDRGRLLGVTTVIMAGDDEKVQTHVGIIKELWSDLVAGENIDQIRAQTLLDRPIGVSPNDAVPSNADEDSKVNAAELAKRTTVRIRPTTRRDGWDDPGWSGVVVTPQGHIVTCGHHDRMPGEPVTVHFSDGREAKGKILGTNRVTDIGVVKITDPGDWPFAKLGLSRRVAVDAQCIFAGYPANNKEITPIVRKGKIAEPKGYIWSRQLHTSGFEVQGGDSGGGLFDENGAVIATLKGDAGSGFTRHIRSEFFHLQWKDLTSGQAVDADATVKR